jgi:putative spermidine/putrescine transport system ATP-binding protein
VSDRVSDGPNDRAPARVPEHAPALRVVGLTVPFGDQPGLADLSFAVDAGERFVIVGSSGAGKTTLLRAIAGLASVTAGTVAVGGRDVTRLPPERRDAVYLHQAPVLFPHLRVLDNVLFPLRVRGVPSPVARERALQALAAVRMEGYAARDPRTLSGGQRHRVALARAVAARPALLLLDEPLASLDPSLRDDVREAIVSIQREHRPALVLVTHDLDEAGLLADRVAVLVDRRIAQTAPPAELFARPATLAVARFLGVANEVAGRLCDGGRFECPLGVLRPGAAHGPAGSAVAVFRPEAARLTADSSGAAGHVVALRHRAHGTGALVRVGAAALEVPVPAGRPPAVGDAVHVAVDDAQVVVFPTEPGAAGA